MTKLLQKALEQVSKLPEGDQDAIAAVLLDELRSEKRWQRAFGRSQKTLAKLADEALAEFETGETSDFFPLPPPRGRVGVGG